MCPEEKLYQCVRNTNVAALCIGGMVLAKALPNSGLVERFRASAIFYGDGALSAAHENETNQLLHLRLLTNRTSVAAAALIKEGSELPFAATCTNGC
jgi:hypothetical protein